MAQDIGNKLDPNSIIKTGSEKDPNKTGSETDLSKTGSELDNNIILEYLVLDEVYSASFGSNSIRLFNFKKVTAWARWANLNANARQHLCLDLAMHETFNN